MIMNRTIINESGYCLNREKKHGFMLLFKRRNFIYSYAHNHNDLYMKQEKWFNRNFNFSSDQNIFPSIIERLSGTPIRLEEKFRYIPSDILTIRVDNTWTIKENAGHLTDLEPLWQGRLEDILAGKTEMRPTDL